MPDADAGEELVHVTAVGICGSDLHWFNEAGIGDATAGPLVLGHEFAAVIASGRGKVSGWRVDPAIPCNAV